MRITQWVGYGLAAIALAAGIRMLLGAGDPPDDQPPPAVVLDPAAPRPVTIEHVPGAVETARPVDADATNLASQASVEGGRRTDPLREVLGGLEGEAVYVEGIDGTKPRRAPPRLPGPGDVPRR